MSEQYQLKRPERPGPEASAAEVWAWMEELDTYNQISAIQSAQKRPPLAVPYPKQRGLTLASVLDDLNPPKQIDPPPIAPAE